MSTPPAGLQRFALLRDRGRRAASLPPAARTAANCDPLAIIFGKGVDFV